VILSTLVLVPVIVLAPAPATGPTSRCGSPMQVVIGLLILPGRWVPTVLRNRLAAVLLVGRHRLRCGTIFAFHGAPDWR